MSQCSYPIQSCSDRIVDGTIRKTGMQAVCRKEFRNSMFMKLRGNVYRDKGLHTAKVTGSSPVAPTSLNSTTYHSNQLLKHSFLSLNFLSDSYHLLLSNALSFYNWCAGGVQGYFFLSILLSRRTLGVLIFLKPRLSSAPGVSRVRFVVSDRVMGRDECLGRT